MRFWDSSAVVPLVCREVQSPRCRSWLRGDPVMIVWAFTAAEVISGLERKRREDALDQRRFVEAKRRLAKLERAWSEVTHHAGVRVRARRLLEIHALSAADSLQLAAALVAVEDRTSEVGFVTFDGRLALAADREGFEVLSDPSKGGRTHHPKTHNAVGSTARPDARGFDTRDAALIPRSASGAYAGRSPSRSASPAPHGRDSLRRSASLPGPWTPHPCSVASSPRSPRATWRRC